MPPSTTTTQPTRPSRRLSARSPLAWCALALLLLLASLGLASPPASLATSLGLSAAALGAAPPPGWRLVWSDEFSGMALDPQKWNIGSDLPGGYRGCCLGFAANAWDPVAVTVADGTLRLQAADRPLAGKPYRSGAITTQGRFAFRYGRLDVRAQLPTGAGLWPAIWLLPVSQRSWLAPYELDLLERYGHDPAIAMTLHWDAHQAACTYAGADFSAGYHLYSLVWTPTALIWLVDGRPACMRTRHIPDVPMYLLLDLAIGGVVGPPTVATHFPAELRVDYVRVYADPHRS